MIEVSRSCDMVSVDNGVISLVERCDGHTQYFLDIVTTPLTVRSTLIVIPGRYFDSTKRRILFSMTITVILLGIRRE